MILPTPGTGTAAGQDPATAASAPPHGGDDHQDHARAASTIPSADEHEAQRLVLRGSEATEAC